MLYCYYTNHYIAFQLVQVFGVNIADYGLAFSEESATGTTENNAEKLLAKVKEILKVK
jgi:hypothetical protein